MEDVWIPLVDEPIGSIVREIEDDDPGIRALVDSPRKLLAFRTFAYIRVGLVLGQLLVDHDLEPYDGTETWIEQMMRDPGTASTSTPRCEPVAEEIAPTRATRATSISGPTTTLAPVSKSSRRSSLEPSKRRSRGAILRGSEGASGSRPVSRRGRVRPAFLRVRFPPVGLGPPASADGPCDSR
jgi:hypothetical protein